MLKNDQKYHTIVNRVLDKDALRIAVYRAGQRGMAAKVIADELGVPLRTVYNIMRKGV